MGRPHRHRRWSLLGTLVAVSLALPAVPVAGTVDGNRRSPAAEGRTPEHAPPGPPGAGTGPARGRGPAQADDRLLVRFQPGTDRAEAARIASDAGTELVGDVGGTGFVEVAVPDGDAAEAARRLEASAAVGTVEPDRIRYAAATPNDQFYAHHQATYLHAVNLPTAWNLTTGADDLILAVLDSGVSLSHPDLAGRLLAGYNVIRPGTPPADDDTRGGHGTMVAGVAAALTNNHTGVAGASWRGRILPVKVMHSDGRAFDSDIVKGIDWAVARGAHVINLSLGGPGASVALQEAIDKATARGVIVVAAAGNENSSVPNYPAAARGVVAVGATDTTGQNRASWSNFGNWLDLTAPGEMLLTTARPDVAPPPRSPFGAGYSLVNGTSFSAPLVSAAVLLLRSVDRNASAATVVDRLRRGARDLGAPGHDPFFGAGLLDVHSSLRLSPLFQFAGGGAVLTGTGIGYWMLGQDGRVYPFGDVDHHGDAVPHLGPGGVAAHLEAAPGGRGYWIVTRAGQVFAFGTAPYHGGLSPGQLRPGEAVTSLSATPTGGGYWLFTSAGRVFPFGTAPFLGDMSAVRLNGPVLGSVPAPTGQGYYMVAADGGIFTFGDAVFAGSMGHTALNAAVQSLVPAPDRSGYWLVASDGGIFAFGPPFRGSMGHTPLNAPVVGMVAFGNGYLMVATDGGVFNFSDLPFAGSLGGSPPPYPVSAVTARPR